jgi:uncharacterized protein YhaN
MPFSSLWRRIGNSLLGYSNELPLQPSLPSPKQSSDAIEVKRTYFFRPFARQNAAIASLQQGFNGLFDILASLQESIDRQNRRQEEIVSYLSHIPDLIHTLPENTRSQSEALRNLNRQLQDTLSQQKQLAELVIKTGENSHEQQAALENLSSRVDSVVENGDRLLVGIRQVHTSISSINQTNDSNTQIVRHIQDALRRQDQSIESAFSRQHARLTTWLAVSLCLSIASTLGLGGLLLYILK